jgi:hypothetical protein
LRRNPLLANFFLLDKLDEIQYFSRPGWIPPAKKTVPGVVLIRHVEGEGLLPELQGGRVTSSGVCIWLRVRHTDLFFLSSLGGHAFFYSVYVFALKMALYAFLALDVLFRTTKDGSNPRTSPVVLAAQFLMLPAAVAMQDDLTATDYLVASLKYCDSIRTRMRGSSTSPPSAAPPTGSPASW